VRNATARRRQKGRALIDVDGKRTERIEVYVSAELELALRRSAEAEDRKLSHYICRALLAHVRMIDEDARAEQVNVSPSTSSPRPVTPLWPDDGMERLA
jgi:hypothetical protein